MKRRCDIERGGVLFFGHLVNWAEGISGSCLSNVIYLPEKKTQKGQAVNVFKVKVKFKVVKTRLSIHAMHKSTAMPGHLMEEEEEEEEELNVIA